jgi:hypothetical protein
LDEERRARYANSANLPRQTYRFGEVTKGNGIESRKLPGRSNAYKRAWMALLSVYFIPGQVDCPVRHEDQRRRFHDISCLLTPPPPNQLFGIAEAKILKDLSRRH